MIAAAGGIDASAAGRFRAIAWTSGFGVELSASSIGNTGDSASSGMPSQMQARGYQYVDANPHLLVNFLRQRARTHRVAFATETIAGAVTQMFTCFPGRVGRRIGGGAADSPD